MKIITVKTHEKSPCHTIDVNNFTVTDHIENALKTNLLIFLAIKELLKQFEMPMCVWAFLCFYSNVEIDDLGFEFVFKFS